MLTEKRYEVILNLLNEKNSVTVTEIKELLGISESTIRRDLAALDKAGKLIKVFGGAVAADGGFTTAEPSVAQKAEINKDEKTAIAGYAASLIERDDFVYLDAGTTTGQMIDFIKEKSATFVTNAVSHAQRLAAQGLPCVSDRRGAERDDGGCCGESGDSESAKAAFFEGVSGDKRCGAQVRVQHAGLQ